MSWWFRPSPQNSLKLTQTNPYPTQNQNLDRVFRGAHKNVPELFNDYLKYSMIASNTLIDSEEPQQLVVVMPDTDDVSVYFSKAS